MKVINVVVFIYFQLVLAIRQPELIILTFASLKFCRVTLYGSGQTYKVFWTGKCWQSHYWSEFPLYHRCWDVWLARAACSAVDCCFVPVCACILEGSLRDGVKGNISERSARDGTYVAQSDEQCRDIGYHRPWKHCPLSCLLWPADSYGPCYSRSCFANLSLRRTPRRELFTPDTETHILYYFFLYELHKRNHPAKNVWFLETINASWEIICAV